MVALKSCPRCHGDVYASGDWYGEYLYCLQCGNVVELVKLKKNIDWSKVKPKAGRPRKTASGRSAA